MPAVDSRHGTPDISSRLAIPASVLAVVTPLMVLLRLAFSKTQRNFGLDDWTALAAMIISEALCVVLILFSNDLLGLEPLDVLKRKALLLLFTTRILYQVAIGVTKISVCLFFKKACGALHRSRHICWGFVASIAAFTAASIVATVLACHPIRLSWSRKVNDGSQCIDHWALSGAITGFDVASWILVMAVGTTLVWRMDLGKLRRCAVAVLFILGACLIAASILRTIYYRAFLTTHSAGSAVNKNLCAVLETCLGIIFACLPTFHSPLRSVSAAFLRESPDVDEMSLGVCAGEGESSTPWQADTIQPEMALLPSDPLRVNPFVPARDPEDILRVHGGGGKALHASLKRFSSENHSRNVTSPLEDPSLLEDVV